MPLCCFDGFPLAFAFEPFRKMIEIVEEECLITRMTNRDIFWNEIVRNVAIAWDKEDVSG